MAELFAYTDGACSGNPGPGGWGVLMLAREAAA
jgi:ribonuclease HI